MSVTYGKNFGYRVSHEGVRTGNGDNKTPAGAALRQGTLVKVDFANPGYLVKATDASGPAGTVGVLTQDDWDEARSIFATDPAGYDSEFAGVCRPNWLSTLNHGAGMTIWVKNTPASNDYGRNLAAVVMFDDAVVPGNLVGWDGTKYVAVTDADLAIGFCRAKSNSTIEIQFTK